MACFGYEQYGVDQYGLCAADDVAENLATDSGTIRRLFLKIDGIKDVFWQAIQPLAPNRQSVDDVPGAHPLLDNTVFCFRGDEYAATKTPVDSGPNGFSTTLSGTVGVIGKTSTPAARLGGARGPFSGTNYFYMTNDAKQQAQTFTLASWVYVVSTTQASNATFVAKEHSGDSDVSIGIGFDGSATSVFQSYVYLSGAGRNLVTASASSAVGWHHVAQTWDGTTHSLYVDGALADSDAPANPGTISYDSGWFTFGRSTVFGATANVYIDDTVLYSVPLSAEWVRRAWLGGLLYSRPGINCLRAPSEASVGIDLREMTAQQSGMTFVLDNVEDKADPGKFYFAKLFAPGRYEASSVSRTWLRRDDTTSVRVAANANALFTNNNLSGWSNSGEGFIARETFSYTAKTTASGPNADTLGKFTGVVKGIYPCIGNASDTWGYTYRYADLGTDTLKGDQASHISISTVPYAMQGRRVALYATTWSPSGNYWHAENNSLLLWTGEISDKISFNSANNTWEVAATSVLEVLQRKTIAGNLPRGVLTRINLRGYAGQAFFMRFKVGSTAYKVIISLPSQSYTADELITAIKRKYDDSANWTPSKNYHILFEVFRSEDGGNVKIGFTNRTGSALDIDMRNGAGNGIIPPALAALGFAVAPGENEGEYYMGQTLFANSVANGQSASWEGEVPPFISFHPIDTRYNGKRLYIDEDGASVFVANQGDDITARAGATIAGSVYMYNAVSADSESSYLSLTGSVLVKSRSYGANLPLALGQTEDSNPVVVTQSYNLHNTAPSLPFGTPQTRGPLETLLFTLLSTGVSNYNNTTYDRVPIELSSVGIQDNIVDIDSFLDMDKTLRGAYPDLAGVRMSPINKSTKWLDLWLQEARLFNLMLVWRNGKITVRRAYGVNVQEQTQTISDSNNAQTIEWVDAESSNSNVVNQFEYKIDYSFSDDKYMRTVVIQDVDSIVSLGQAMKRVVEHIGLKSSYSSNLEQSFKDVVSTFSGFTRYPWQRIEVTLAPTLCNLVFVGDVVKYTSSRYPDPFGSGQMSTTCYGVITDLTWNYLTWTGRATIYLNTAYDSTKQRPWAASACTNISATNGGWDSANYRLTLNPLTYGKTGDTDDGARFAAGDKVKIRERSADQGSVTGPWSATVASAYETDGANILTLNAVTLTSHSTTREYVVVPDDYATATADQKETEAYLADNETADLGSGDQPHRYT